jgi:tetratricopeptide (TPR) repeat protein
MTDATDNVRRIRKMEDLVEDAMWMANLDGDYERAVRKYESSLKQLESMTNLSTEEELERKRVISYCLMRINDAMDRLGQSGGSVDRAKQALQLAEESEDIVQTLRAKLALGIALLNSGNLNEAEQHFGAIIKQTKDEHKNTDLVQIYGWTLIVRVNILMGKSLYNQAKVLAEHALRVLSGIKNYAGLRTVCSLLAKIHQIEGNQEMAASFKAQSDKYGELAIKNRR